MKKIGLLVFLCLMSFLGFSQGKTTSYVNPSKSVLASGNWYKIGIEKTGIYKITYADLEKLGVEMSGLKSSQISVYGNGGGMLPENNDIPRYADLTENAVQIVNDANGNFSQNSYILFYAQGPDKWELNTALSLFSCKIHTYSKQNYYFISIGESSTDRKRIQKQTAISETANQTITQFDDYQIHKIESDNIQQSGNTWFGEKLTSNVSSITIPFNMQDVVIGSNIQIYLDVASNSTEASGFTAKFNDKFFDTIDILSITESTVDYFEKNSRKSVQAEKAGNSVGVFYKCKNSMARGWLERIELNYLRNLRLSTEQVNFRSLASIGEGNISKFVVDNANSKTQVWDVTDPLTPVLMNSELQSSQLSFTIPTDSLREFVSFNGNSSLSPDFSLGKIENQNLHELAQTDYVIITHPEFLAQADTLANLHKTQSGLDVTVVTIDKVYNEFSSGMQDPMAIRAFMKMFYDRAKAGQGKEPRYLLLFGTGTYDPKGILPSSGRQKLVAYQSGGKPSYTSDDVFGFLENPSSNILNIGIGRFPVTSVSEANILVEKSKNYLLSKDIVEDKENGDWRNIIALVADDPDGDFPSFSDNSENLAANLVAFPNLNIEKIYADAYKEISTPSGTKYPDVTKAITNRMNKGCLMIDYVGHGAWDFLGHEYFVTQTDIASWKNGGKLPVFVTNTCEFAHFDFTNKKSAGENTLVNPSGGCVALISSTRKVVEDSHLNSAWFMNVLSPVNGVLPTLGDAVRKTKNTNRHNLEYILLGDPALSLSVPKNVANTLKINSKDITVEIDTVKSLSNVFIEGNIENTSKEKLTDFNGTLFVTVYDKPMKIQTLGNSSPASIVTFEQQKSIIYKGFAKVVNGDFVISFTVPKDISYQYGYGKISYFAQNDSLQAAGYYGDLVIGDIDETQTPDTTAPVVKLYMNDENFHNGGITDPNPVLYAVLQDKYGINMVGSGIGHDIEAILDEKVNNVFVLNDYYINDTEDPTKGYVLYPFNNLSEGTHTLQLKVWNIYNVSTTVSITFEVKGSKDLEIGKFHIYPNPFSTTATFELEENQPGNIESAVLQIFNTQGQMVREMDMPIYENSYVAGPLVWDGTSANGARLSNGIFVARIIIKTKNNEEKVISKKLIMLLK